MANTGSFGGQVAVVTGGAQGIGRAIVDRFVRDGAKVAIWDRDINLAKQAAAEIGASAKPYAVDVGDAKSVDTVCEMTLKEFGRIDILVNNAGIAGPTAKLWEYPITELQATMRVNFEGPFNCCHAVVPAMITQNYGRIVNIASIAGKEGNPNASAYSASKAALIGLTKSLGKELATYDIAVNAIAPAVARTAILGQTTQAHIDYMVARIPRGRTVEVQEIAALVAWAASRECSFTTGFVFDISGGRATY
ncbi:MAG: SDR family oxidoreductase [Pseudolabrys sp.]|nr:SDR family oxidoreductase [Pseudolabrys sp.]MBV9262583.1 SDR family oxidoreductase [Pseudolabrys sp.]